MIGSQTRLTYDLTFLLQYYIHKFIILVVYFIALQERVGIENNNQFWPVQNAIYTLIKDRLISQESL